MRPPTGGQVPVDGGAATVAADGVRAGALFEPARAAAAPSSTAAAAIAAASSPAGTAATVAASPRAQAQAGPAWGTAILVNRDGSDGQRYPLAGEYLVIGRAGADIVFDDDRFLGRPHARLERGADGAVKIVPLETLNGVFRKTDAPLEIAEGAVILVGREVLRFERVDPDEAKPHPLVRHGVALFGSPPREPWGRLVQLVPSGGHRDVRHLSAEEVVLGREEGDIVFRDDAFMSRRHAALAWDGRRALLTDLGSSNGTFVRITGPTPLKHGDHVRMGDQLLRIELGR
jgi:pSer/pThr/pTyr-binding forkhead associated (FHA) protein